ncbi:MAG: ECF-type sigma factor [Planctomycetota bacterium]
MSQTNLTQLLRAARDGEEGAADRLIEGVYSDLRQVARLQFRREAPGHTLQPTALVNEAWLRLAGQEGEFENRAEFFAAAAQAMRRILIDHARMARTDKRGGGAKRETMTQLGGVDRELSVLQVDDALQALEREYPDLASIVELRFFAGLTVEEVAEVLGISTATVKRHWAYARAWLFEKMGGAD